MMAIALGEPNNARARPSSLIKSDDDYTRVFNPEYPIDVYLRVVRWMRRVDGFLTAQGLPSAQRNNLKYHLAYFAVGARLGRDPEPPLLGGVEVDLSDDYLETCAGMVDHAISQLADAEARTQDQVAKGNQIVPELRRQLTQVWSGELAIE
jgi:hypothetical protein